MNVTTVDLERLQRAAALLDDVTIDPSIWPEIKKGISAAADAFAARLHSNAGTPDVARTEPATLSWAVGRAALSGMTNALELVRQPALALDRSGYVIDTNRLAAPLLGHDILIRKRRLCVCDRRAAVALDSLVEQLSTASDTAMPATQPIVVHRDGKRPLVIAVVPIDGVAGIPFLSARVLLVLTDLDAEHEPDSMVIAHAFGLSPAETRLALLIGSGTSPAEAAAELGIARETARSQLKTVFAKTGTRRQAELVALMARVARLPKPTSADRAK